MFYVSESNKDKSTSELHFSLSNFTRGREMDRDSQITYRNSDIAKLCLKVSIIFFIIQKPKSDKIRFGKGLWAMDKNETER